MTFERVVAGHRVLRLLAHGDRSEVWLAAGELVLKVLSPPVPAGAMGREAEALHRARGEHVVELLDVSAGAAGSVLVFPRLPLGSLADLLRRRPALDAGEAVTVLAPIAAAITRLHGAGVAHGRLSPGSVLFRSDGAPMLIGFGGAELFEPGLPEIGIEKIAGVMADRAALLHMAEAILVRSTGGRGKVAARLIETLRNTSPGELPDRMVRELFELAAARPVRFEADAVDESRISQRMVEVSAEQVDADAEPRGSGMSAWVERVFETGPGSVARVAVRDRWTKLSTFRRRMVIAGGAAVLTIAVVTATMPGASSPPQAASGSSPMEGDDDAGAVQDGENQGDATPDDPVDALVQLAERRNRCFRDLSVLCLDDVDEAGSSAFEADRAALQAIVDGGDAPNRLEVGSVTLTERLGDSALLDLGPHSDPASVLLLKGEAGWRIRDYLAPLDTGESKGG